MITEIARLRAKKGFTIIETIVVIAIIGILAMMVVPMLTYDNNPGMGKAIAKQLYYSAQDVMSTVEAANPLAIPSTATKPVVFYAKINRAGFVEESGTAAVSGSASAMTVTCTKFPGGIVVKHDKSQPDDEKAMYEKVRDMFAEKITSVDSMPGIFFFVVDKNYKVLTSYWTDYDAVANKSIGAVSIVDNCLLENGYYCCSFPVSYCDPLTSGEFMFSAAV